MLLRILPILILTILVPDLYIYYFHIHHKHRARWIKVLFWAPTAILLLLTVWMACSETLSPQNMEAIELYLTFYMLFALPKNIYMLVSLAGKLVGRFIPPYRKINTGISTTCAAVTFMVMAYGTVFGPSHLKVRKTEFVSQDLPKIFDGYRIVQLSDLHLVSFKNHPETVKDIVDLVQAQHPDLIVFTGDLVSTDVTEMEPYLKTLAQLKAPDGVYSILGNHDYMTYARYMTPVEQAHKFEQLKQLQNAIGWKLLLNEHQVLHKGSDSIAIIGVENDGKPPFPERGDLVRAQKGLDTTQTVFKVLLSHDPTHWRRKVLPETDIQLTLSGHTHGMQLMLFGWSPSQHIYPEWHGMYQDEHGRALNVSLGLGGALIPFRFGAWPEINVITLRSK